MKKVGSTRIDMIAVSNITIEPTKSTHSMTATVAFLDSRLGQSVGYSECAEGWSEQTRKALADLVDSIENDVAQGLADQGGGSPKPQDSTGTGGGLFND